MLTVKEALINAAQVVGTATPSVLLMRLNEAIQLLAYKQEWRALMGTVDLAVYDQFITLPNDVESPIAMTIDGATSLPIDENYSYIYNGPGHGPNQPANAWQYLSDACIQRPLPAPQVLSFQSTIQADVGKEVWCYGTDINGNQLKTLMPDGTFTLGWKSTIQMHSNFRTNVTPVSDAPVFVQITQIVKPVTEGRIYLRSWNYQDLGGTMGTVLSVMDPDEQIPQYKRVRVNGDYARGRLVRLYFRKKNLDLKYPWQIVPFGHKVAVTLAIQAANYYAKNEIEKGNLCEANAARLLTEAELATKPNSYKPIQFYNTVMENDNLE